MKKWHFFSGLLLSSFIFAHLTNHVVIWLGDSTHIEVMSQLRAIYRNPIIETILLTSVLIQVYTGIIQLKNSWKVIGLFQCLQTFSGLYMAIFLFIHVSAILCGRYLKIDTNLYFGAAGINEFPFQLFFIPYYTLAINAFFIHIASIHYFKTSGYFSQKSRTYQSSVIILLGIVVSALIIIGMRQVQIPASYQLN